VKSDPTVEAKRPPWHVDSCFRGNDIATVGGRGQGGGCATSRSEGGHSRESGNLACRRPSALTPPQSSARGVA
jgi:hypothetical protein